MTVVRICGTTQRHAGRGMAGEDGWASAGFTLLEVMIAVAILAITLSVLFGSQSQSLSLAAEAKFNTRAAFLLEIKLAELEAGLLEIYDDEGDFGDEYPQYRWTLEVEDAYLQDFDIAADFSRPLKRILVTVSWVDSPYSHSLAYYLQERAQP